MFRDTRLRNSIYLEKSPAIQSTTLLLCVRFIYSIYFSVLIYLCTEREFLFGQITSLAFSDLLRPNLTSLTVLLADTVGPF